MSQPFAEEFFKEALKERKIILQGAVKEDLLEKVTLQIMKFNEDDEKEEREKVGFERKPIRIYINSPGGWVTDGLSVVSAIESSKTPVHTIVTGQAYSMGFIILVSGHRRFAQKHSVMMYHPMSACHFGEYQRIVEDLGQCLAPMQAKLEEIVARRTAISTERLLEVREKKIDWYIWAEEAVQLKVADEVI